MQAATKPYTYADYADLPDGAPYQLIDGVLIMSPAPTPHHQRILFRLAVTLDAFVQDKQRGEVMISPIDVYLSETDVFQPDLLFIAQSRLSIIGEQKIEGAPDLVAEILSPSTAYYDLKQKKRTYEAAGVREYWIVDPIEKSIEVYANAEGGFERIDRAEADGHVASRLLDGFTIALTELF